MEVHHHAHTARKKWTHYFWEFLMLFLAVFCGFLAEYQLEHKIERHRATEYAASLHHDLTTDTTRFNQVASRLEFCIAKIDTLIHLLGLPEAVRNNPEDIYRLSVYAFIFPRSDANESTLQQLLNSGSLRYFRDDSLVYRIKNHNIRVQNLKEFGVASNQFNIEFRKAQAAVIEINPLLEFMNRYNFLSGEDIRKDITSSLFQGHTLLTYDAVKLKEYANWCALKKFYMSNTISALLSVKETSLATLERLNK
jgi:hypothetical protein